MATTEQGTTNRHDEQMDKLRISNGQIQAAPLGQPLSDDAGAASGDNGTGSEVAEMALDGLLPPNLRRNFIIPPKERALECIGTSQRNLHAARRAEDEKKLGHWKWESLHWLGRCGKWSNHKRKVESR